MALAHDIKQDRMVRVFTDKAVFDGLLRLSLLGRTLDELNSSSRTFLLLDSPTLKDEDEQIAPQIAINKSSILFAHELDVLDAIPSNMRPKTDKTHIAQSVLFVSLADYRIEGNVHVFQTGHPLARIYMPGHPFIALTAATLAGPGLELSTPFLAVNRTHVLCAHESFRVDAVMVEPSSPKAFAQRT